MNMLTPLLSQSFHFELPLRSISHKARWLIRITELT